MKNKLIILGSGASSGVPRIDGYWGKCNRKNKKKINVYGNYKTINELKNRFKFCFKKTSSYPAIVKGNIVKKKFSLGDYEGKINFKSFEAKHGLTKSVIYIFSNTAYISDCSDLSIVNKKELQNLNNLIIDCSRLKKYYSHFNLSDALFINKVLKPKKTILTNLESDIDYNFILKMLPKNVLPAYDGLSIDL